MIGGEFKQTSEVEDFGSPFKLAPSTCSAPALKCQVRLDRFLIRGGDLPCSTIAPFSIT